MLQIAPRIDSTPRRGWPRRSRRKNPHDGTRPGDRRPRAGARPARGRAIGLQSACSASSKPRPPEPGPRACGSHSPTSSATSACIARWSPTPNDRRAAGSRVPARRASRGDYRRCGAACATPSRAGRRDTSPTSTTSDAPGSGSARPRPRGTRTCPDHGAARRGPRPAAWSSGSSAACRASVS